MPETPEIVFIDTEFTDLLAPELLSIGLVAMDGREFYAELDLATETGKSRIKASGNFTRGGVLDMWGLVPGAAGTEMEMGHRTGEWLLGLAKESGTRIQVAFDFSTDYELMEYLIRDSGLGTLGKSPVGTFFLWWPCLATKNDFGGQ